MSNGQHRSAVPRSAACVRVASSVGEEALHQLVAHEVQSDELRCHPIVEVAPHGIAEAFVQLRRCLSLSVNRLTDGTCRVSTFRRLFDDENDLAHIASPWVGMMVPATMAFRPVESAASPCRERSTE